MKYIDRLIPGLIGVSATCFSFIPLCGRYNQQCGGSVQVWQVAVLVLAFVGSIAIYSALRSRQ